MKIRISMLAAAATVSLAAAPALAAGDAMELFYTNTMTSLHADGELYNVYFNRDHTFKVTHKGKIERSGTFTYTDGKLCMKGDFGNECPPFRADLKVGESWDAVNAKGAHDILTLVAGRKE